MAALSPARAGDTLPLSVDNSTKEYFPPVFNQIGGSCAQASIIGYVFTYEMNALLDRPADTPENRFNYLFTWNFVNEGKDQGSITMDGVLLSFKSGIMTDADFPKQYSSTQFYWASGYDKYYRAMHYKSTALVDMRISNEEELQKIKEYLYNDGKGHLVSISSAARGWRFDYDYDGPSQTGYRCMLTGLPTDGGHAMSIVGYDDTVECAFDGRTTYGAFIVVNSYGDDFHDRGFFYMPYRFFMEEVPKENILSKQVAGVSVKYYEPRLVFKVNVDYTSRNDLGFMMGVADKPYSERPTAQVVSSIVNFQGGDYPMQGRGASSQIELALDATPIAIALDTIDKPKFFLRVDRKQIGKEGTGRLLGYEVHDYGTGRTYTFNEQCAPFEYGVNLYGLATTPLVTFSASRVDWLTRDKEPVTSPLVVRTAKGKYAKIRITKKGDEISFKYVYAPDGSVHLGN